MLDLSGKAEKQPLEATVVRGQIVRPQHVSAIPQALMIDVKNITGQKTLLLKKDAIKIGRGVHNDPVVCLPLLW